MSELSEHGAERTAAPWPEFRFVRWADAQPQPLTWEQVQAFLGCSRAKAYRWLSAYNSSRGHVQ